MWASWFGSSKKKHNQSQVNHIKNLLLESSKNTLQKTFSPTLQDLQQNKKKVKRLSTIFETQVPASDGHNSVSIQILQKGAKIDLFPKIAEECHEHKETKANLLIKKLLILDKEHVKMMEALIEHYVRPFEDALSNFMDGEMREKFKIETFGTIEKIYEFHCNEFQQLSVFENDLIGFARALTKMIKDGKFNAYFVFTIYENAIKFRRDSYHCEFMLNASIKCKDYNYDDFQPVLLLAKYHCIILDIVDRLESNNAPLEQIAAITETQDVFTKMMNLIYEIRNHSWPV
jgi:hypothetical protein